MKLPNLPFNKKEVKKDYFLSIVITHEKVSATVFEETAGKINVVGVGNELFKEDVEKATEEEFLQNLDKAISVAEGSLPENVTTHKTIFGLKEAWIEEGKVKKDYLIKLKKACDELDLKPVGFLTISEAVAHLLEKEEGAPITAILAQIGETAVTVSLIKAGKVKETKTAPIHENVPFTVDALLKHFQIPEVLPARILLLSGGSEEMVQDFMNFTWSKSLPFLHFPQVQKLPLEFDSKAVLEGAAVQMGFSVKEVEDFFEDEKEEMEPVDLEKEERKPHKEGEEFGFMKEEDIAKSAEEAETEEIPSDNLVTKEELEEEEVRTPKARTAFLGIGLVKAKTALTNLNLGGLFKKTPALIRSGRAKIMIIPGVILILLVLILYLYLFRTSATITLSISPRTDSGEQNVTFATSASTDISKNIVAADSVSTSEDGKVTTKATGTKKTGDPAKGKIVIFSTLTQDQTFSKGTTITSNGDLDFTLDSDAKVASSSGASDVKQVTVGVTSSSFGKEYNLPSGTKFSVGNFDKSAVEAKNDEAFSGGTEKDITVVSKDDQTKLTTDLTKKLEAQAKDDIKKKVSDGTLLLPVFIKETFDAKSYSKDVGDETTEVSLTGTIDFDGLTYKESDVFEFAKNKLGSSNKDLSVNPKDFNVTVKNVKVKTGGDVSATLVINASLIPKIQKEDIVNQIKGTSLGDAETILQGLPLVNSVDIKISPPIPLLPKRIPSPSRIKILLDTNG